MSRIWLQWSIVLVGLSVVGSASGLAGESDARTVAARVDRIIETELMRNDTPIAPPADDEDFLRRVTFDLAGTTPTPSEVTRFGIDPAADKRQRVIDRLLASDEFNRTWARYFKDLIFSRATNARYRIMEGSFTQWMTEQLAENQGWDEITTDLLTATGDVREEGATGLIFAYDADASELAAESARIFLGIQVQCANCHDHPSDSWKRKQFHEMAAFFPRIRVRPVRVEQQTRSWEVVSFDQAPRNGRRQIDPERLLRFLDRNEDGKITRIEARRNPQFERNFERLVGVIDADGDKALSADELKNIPAPPMGARFTTEHFMPDLSDPSEEGTKMQPVFFLTSQSARTELPDIERRQVYSRYITARSNEWFAKAFVNRIWAEMTGEGFYMPVDDMGPEREALFEEALTLLAEGFTANKYDIRWLFRTIASTQAYQRQLQTQDAPETALPFAAAIPTRLRGDQVYSALARVLGVGELGRPTFGSGPARRRPTQPRTAFNNTFGFDPSTPQDELTGTVPQALLLMNSPTLNSLISARGDTRLARLLKQYDDNEDALSELYALVLAREPSAKELAINQRYLAELGSRAEAFEDILWSLVNSTEFLSRR